MRISLGDPLFLTILLAAAVLLALILIAIAVFLVLKSRKRKSEEKPEDSKADQKEHLFARRVPGMVESFREAMRRIREKLPGWNYRYEVPWFALVGESGSGKTTIADLLAGRSTDVVEPEFTDYAPRWLLLDKAVLIDVPGKSFLASPRPAAVSDQHLPPFLDNDGLKSHLSSDRIAWRNFLRLTARFRPRQPLNGIVLTVSAAELLDAAGDPDHPQRLARIADLSQRLDEIQRFLNLSLPVYVLITKCDTVTGFASYSRNIFEKTNTLQPMSNGNASTEISDDLFGWSNPHSLDSSFTPAWVDEAFYSTNEVLLQRQLEMLAETETPAAADGLFLFPFELQRLRMPLRFVLDRIFKTTAYHSPHLLRGIYFCGRKLTATPEVEYAPAALTNRKPSPGIFEQPVSPVVYVRHLFETKVFPERYLAAPIARTFFSSNRSVFIAQIAACVLVVLLGAGSIHAWNRIGSLQRNRINPVLESLHGSLDTVAVSSGSSVTSAVDLFDTLGAAHETEYYALALPYSYLDLDGLHRDLRETLERTFEIVVLRSCKFALESRISALLHSSPASNLPANQSVSDYPPGNAWTADPAYRELASYLSDLRILHTNIDRYRLISSAGSGSFKQLNELLRYLGGRDLPDSTRFAQDTVYQKLLLDATWQPLDVSPDYDQLTAEATQQRVANFYRSWFEANPLIGEIQGLAGKDGLQSLATSGAELSNEQLRAIVSRSESIDSQLKTGTYDWLAENFDREDYPALGPELDEMPFADREFIDGIVSQGSQKLAGLKAALQTTPAILDLQDGNARLNGPVRTLASVLDATLSYELMGDTYESPAGSVRCALIPAGTIWNQAELSKALELDAMRGKIENELLPDLPGEYSEVVRRLVDQRTANALSLVLQGAAVPNPERGDRQAVLQTELQNLDQSFDKLKQIGDSLTALHAASEDACLNKSLNRQASSLLLRINQQLPAIYSHAAPTGNAENERPLSQWLYEVDSKEDLQEYLATERQQIETFSAEATPLVQLLRTGGGQSTVLTKWHNISQDVQALQAKKPGNPIQTLESFILTDLDKIVPEAGCKSTGLAHSSDIFLNARAELARIAVEHCHEAAISRFNDIAADFNKRLAGHFPFSQLADTRPGAEADPADIAEFYQTLDRKSPGLLSVLPAVADKPDGAVAFLSTIATVRPLVSGTAKEPEPALGLSARFRTNRNREIFGDRIAQWNLQIGQQALNVPPDNGEGAPLIWHFGDPVELALRYANNAPEIPAPSNPSPAARVQGKTVTYQYSDAWSLFAMLRDHPSGIGDQDDQYVVTIPNTPASGFSGSAPPADTVAYIQLDVLPVGAKPGGDTLPVPVFPYKAPVAVLKPTRGE